MKKSKVKAEVVAPTIEGRPFTLYNASPIPEVSATPFADRDTFLPMLRKVQDAAQLERIRGLSCCPYCRETMMLGEYTKDNWLWSYCYQHMIEHHNVTPSAEFIAYVEAASK